MAFLILIISISTDIEPFTLVLVDWSNELETYELVWDGLIKHFNKLPQEPKIWSSSTLYTARNERVEKRMVCRLVK